MSEWWQCRDGGPLGAKDAAFGEMGGVCSTRLPVPVSAVPYYPANTPVQPPPAAPPPACEGHTALGGPVAPVASAGGATLVRRALITVAAGSVLWLTLPGFISSLRPPEGMILDFFKEWASARNVREGKPAYTNQRVTAERYLGIRAADLRGYFEDYNAHPPAAILLALPFAGLSYPTAQFVWNLASLAALLVALAVIGCELHIAWPAWAWLPAAAALMLCDPFRQTVIQGQLNFVLLLLITLAWRFDRRQAPWWVGTCLGAATAIKLFPGFLFLYCLMQKRWTALISGALTFLTVSALTTTLLGQEAWADYLHKSLPALAAMCDAWGNVSVDAFFARLFDAHSQYVEPLLHAPMLRWSGRIAGIAAVVTTCGWVSARAQSPAARDCAFAASLVAMLLASPIAWHHYFVLLFLPLVLVARAARGSAGRRRQALAVAVAAALMLSPRIVWAAVARLFPEFVKPLANAASGEAVSGWKLSSVAARPAFSLTALSYQFYALVILFIVLTVLARRYDDMRATNTGAA